jgi:acylphosphatase
VGAASAAVRTRVIFSGRVQGVFFRATSREIARCLAVTGFVRNLSDGTVELEAQGASDQVRGLVAAIRDRYAGGITSIDETAVAALENEASFRIL